MRGPDPVLPPIAHVRKLIGPRANEQIAFTGEAPSLAHRQEARHATSPSVARSHSDLVSAYSTSPSYSPSMESGHSWWKIRTNLSPAFSITRWEATFTTIVVANTRWTSSSAKALSISAREPSLA